MPDVRKEPASQREPTARASLPARAIAPRECHPDTHCPTCHERLVPEHTHAKCPKCGYRDSCCF
jgi:hypothetical protein